MLTKCVFLENIKISDEEYTDSRIPPVTEKQWLDHFNKLHSKPQNKPEHDVIEQKLSDMEKSNVNVGHELDEPITEKKFKSLSKKLKNKKAAFSDKVNNEMIKTSINFLYPAYQKLFNFCNLEYILTYGVKVRLHPFLNQEIYLIRIITEEYVFPVA